MSEVATLPVAARASTALESPSVEAKIKELILASQSITAITNKAGREECHAAMMQLKRLRTGITEAGKTARSDAQAFAKAVIAEESRLAELITPEEQRLTQLRDTWDAEIEREKEAKAQRERERILEITNRIEAIRASVDQCAKLTPEEIEAKADELVALDVSEESFQEFTIEAEVARDTTVSALLALAAKRREQLAEDKRLTEERARLEADRAELEQQRAALQKQQAEAEARAEEERKRIQAEADAKAQRARDEANRITRIDARIAEFGQHADEAIARGTSKVINEAIGNLTEAEIWPSVFEERATQAEAARFAAVERLRQALTVALKAEEFARQRIAEEAAERDRREAEEIDRRIEKFIANTDLEISADHARKVIRLWIAFWGDQA